MINISVLITCHNRKKKTLHILNCLKKQKINKNIKIIIYLVDDGSTDGTANSVKKLYPEIILIKGNGDLFWGGALNLAWKKAVNSKYKSDYFLWLNDDVDLFNDAISNSLDYEKKNSYKNFICVGSTLDSNSNLRSYGGYKLKKKIFNLINSYPVIPTNDFQNIDIFNGNFVLIPNKVFNQVGYLDKLFIHNGADTDYGMRAQKLGIKIVLMPEYVGYCNKNTNKFKSTKYLNLDMFYFMKRYLKTFKYVYIAKWYFTYLINIIFKINLFK